MGAEESRPVDGSEPQHAADRTSRSSVNGCAAGAGQPDTEPSTRSSMSGGPTSAAGNGSKAAKASAARATSPGKSTWMRPSQRPVSNSGDQRIASERIRQPLSRKSPAPGTLPAAEATAAATAAAAAAEREVQQKLEASKRDLVSKISSQIKSSHKKALALQPSKVPELRSQPEAQEGKRSWLGKLTRSKEASLEQMGAKLARGRYLEPLTPEEVGSKVEGQMGENLEQFAGFQGAVHDIMQQGVPDEVLDQFFLDEEQERALTTYQKWQVIRHAAEQVLAVYANRSNSQWIEGVVWAPPRVINTTTVAASSYANAVDGALQEGNIALLFIDDGRLAEMGGDEASPLVCSDLWQAIKELAPHKVPSGQRLERLSVAGRHLLQAAVSIEMWYGAAALQKLKVVLAVDCDVEWHVVNELQLWGFFGLATSNVVILPLPRFHGFAQDVRSGHLGHVKGSPRLMLGTGYAMFLLNSPAEGYTLSGDGSEPQCLQASALEWLAEGGATWLYTGLFSDMERLRPEAMLSMDFLAAAVYAADRAGCNMAVEVVAGEQERDARNHDSVVLSRSSSHQPTATSSSGSPSSAGPVRPVSRGSIGSMSTSGSCSIPGTPGAAANGAAAGAHASNCNLRVSSMKTARAYQLLHATASSPHGFYVATHRYMFSVKALQGMLVDAAAFHADVYLQGFYAYATFDISDLTTFGAASCAAVLCQGGAKGPLMADVIYGRDWLAYAAGILALQDRVKEFRRKAIQLVDAGRLAQQYSGYTVLLVLSPEHGRLAKAAVRMARLFVTNMEDRLHVLAIASEKDSKLRVRDVLDATSDKELEFNGQMAREAATRQQGASVAAMVLAAVERTGAQLVVVPSERLCSSGRDGPGLGQLSASLALTIARCADLQVPVLVVKANTVGKYLQIPAQGTGPGGPYASPPPPQQQQQTSNHAMLKHSSSSGAGPRDSVVGMVLLEGASVGPVVEYVASRLAPGADQLFLTKAQAMEAPGAAGGGGGGQLSMRSRRAFVQARMSVAQAVRVEERAFAGGLLAEVPKAVDAEGVDLLALAVPPDLPLAREAEQLLLAVRTSVLLHRYCPPTAASGAPSAQVKQNSWV